MFKSAVYKLTFFYVVLAISLSLFFSVALFYFAHTELKEGLSRQYNELTLKESDSSLRSYRVVNEGLNQASNHLLLDFIYLNVSVLVLSALIGYFLAKRTLRPIQASLLNQTRFAEEASHELKTPLTAIKASSEAELMTNKKNISGYRKLVQANIKDIDKLQELINYLLEIAKEGNIKPENMEKLEIETLINDVLETLQSKADQKQIKIFKDISKTKFRGDKTAIRQLLIIILDNAIKYSKEEKTIEIYSKPQNNNLLIRIKDYGIGISSNELKHVFERFYQAPKQGSSNKSFEGFGLGLFIAREIVKKHSGKITINSKDGDNSYTVIEVLLPLK